LSAKAKGIGNKGEKIILIREETNQEMNRVFFQSSEIVTSKGVKISHSDVFWLVIYAKPDV
jgi:phosphoenolpyruvate synthase/pyruvate phosphate dikinase